MNDVLLCSVTNEETPYKQLLHYCLGAASPLIDHSKNPLSFFFF